MFVDNSHSRSQCGLGWRRNGHSCVAVDHLQAPRKTENAAEKDDGAERDQARVKTRQLRHLAEVNQTVENGDDVIDAEDEWVEDAGAALFQAAVEIEELRQSKRDHGD